MRELLSDDYTVSINGQEIGVYVARVSAVPFNQVWSGYQRPIDQTELASFAYWDMDGPVEVVVSSSRPVEEVVIRPRSRGVAPAIRGNRVVFTLERPAHITVEINGYHKALHLFGSPPEGPIPDRHDPNVIFFEPGVHDAGKIDLQSGQTVYISGGAVVYGAIEARNVSRLKILGRGILDGSRFPRSWSYEADFRAVGVGRSYKHCQEATDPEPFGTIALYGCDDVEINGIITRDPNLYNVTLVACSNVRISEVKIIGSWRYNSDGIDLLNSRNVTIERCFVRSFDDSIVMTGIPKLKGFPCGHFPCRDITVRDCVIWNDWGRALEIGVHCSAPEISNVAFLNCDIIHVTHVAMDIQHGGRAIVKNIRFEDIRVELDDGAPAPRIQSACEDVYVDKSNGMYCPHLCVLNIIKHSIWTRDKEPGHVRDIVFRNIVATGNKNPPSHLVGYDASHVIEDVTFENLIIEGRFVADEATGCLFIGDHVLNVKFKVKTAEQDTALDGDSAVLHPRQ